MTTVGRRVGEVLRLERISVDPLSSIEYTSVGVRGFGKGIFHYDPKPGDQLGSLHFFELRPDRLVISNIKGWEGAIAVSSEVDSGCIASNRFLSYVPIEDQIDVRWARWYFLSERGIEKIQRASPGSADRNRTLAIERFEALKIPLPPINEQRRVVAELERVALASSDIVRRRNRSNQVAAVLPLSVRAHLEQATVRAPTRLGEALELVRSPVSVDPQEEYVSIGIRSFGKGLFHYPRRPGDQIGKLRFQSVTPNLLAVSNIKAWEGAVATTTEADRETVASNRFLLFRPRAGADASDYFWALLLGSGGIAALGQASPGSADRNRTLAIDRFLRIELPMPGLDEQAALGRRIRAVRASIAQFEKGFRVVGQRIDALLPAAMNAAYARLG